MQYRKYGKLGYEVSLFGMGCMRLPRVMTPDGGAEIDKEKAFEMIRYAADNGVNYFDTAFGYHSQQSEGVVGEALEGERRARVKIATKQPLFAIKEKGDIRRNLENTLKKLRTDYLDVYLLHNIMGATWERFLELDMIGEYEKFKQEGLIRAIGFSYHGQYPAFETALNAFDWDMCQVQQNFFDVDKEVTEKAIISAGEKGCALVIMEPLRGGGLAVAPPEVQAMYTAYDEKRAPAEWGFRHLVNYPQVSTILSGVSTLEQLKEDIAIFSQPNMVPGCLSAEEKDILHRAKQAYEARITIGCTGCEYCLPCPQNVAIPGIFQKFNDAHMFDHFDNARRTYYLFNEKVGSDATQCIECGACEAACPQHLPIMEDLKKAHAVLTGHKE